MNHLTRIQDLLPSPYSLAADSILTQLLQVVAVEMEAFQEDLDRMRQSHWIELAYRLLDAEKIAALAGIARLPWENLETFRVRLLPLIKARLEGALGPKEIKRFVFEYLLGCEKALSDLDNRIESRFVPGLQTVTLEQAFGPLAARPLFRHLTLLENPQRLERSGVLSARSGRIPYLYRWNESNKGLADTVASFAISGVMGNKTAVPILVNETTGDLLGYAGTIPFGATVVISPQEGADGLAQASLNEVDVTDRLFSVRGFTLGVPFTNEDLDEMPRLPRMVRGSNRWIFLSVGLYDVKGLNHFFFSMAGQHLHEGVYDDTFFDQALFPAGIVAQLEMSWQETEPASFRVQVPRHLVIEPASIASGLETRPYQQIAEGLEDSVRQLHAAGVRAEVDFISFVETQNQKVRVSLPWKTLDRERGSTGTVGEFALGGRFGETNLGGSRYE